MNNILFGQTNEKSLHNALKLRYEPDVSFHEKECEGFIADIKRENHITEIQTGALKPLGKKLDILLSGNGYSVEIIHPVIVSKTIILTDEDSGEAISVRKSPKTGKTGDALKAIYGIRQYLLFENLSVKILYINATEYRVTDRKHRKSRRGQLCLDTVPTEYLREEIFSSPEDYEKLLSGALPEEFTVKELEKACGLRRGEGSYAAGIFSALGIITKCGKIGRAFLYKRQNTVDIRK